MVVKKDKDERTRNWTFVLYPESAPSNWKELLDEIRVPWVESPLHDKDVNPDGTLKKHHWHIALFFSSKKSYSQILEITEMLNCPVPQKIENAKGMIRYFIHLDNPEKHQYEKDGLLCHCGADVSKYFTQTGGDKLKIVAEMNDWIDENNCTEFADLVDYARRYRFDDWYEVIVNQSTKFLNDYIRSNRYRTKKTVFVDYDDIERVEEEFLTVKASDCSESEKIEQYRAFLDGLEQKFGNKLVKPTEDEMDDLEVVVYRKIKKELEGLENGE